VPVTVFSGVQRDDEVALSRGFLKKFCRKTAS